MKTRNRRNHNRGFTLVEMLMAVFILSIGILISLLTFAKANVASQLAKDVTIATTHAEYVLEDMYSRTTLADITGEDWPAWVSTEGLDTLPSETVTIAFEDTAANPLNVTTTVAWVRKGSAESVTLTTEITK